MDILKLVASSSEATETGLVEMLGIDWKMFIFQVVAFLVMVLLLGKFVYPWLIKSVDERQQKIEIGAKAASEAEKKASDAEERIAKLLKQAHSEANDIVTAAKVEAATTLSETEEKSKRLADQIAAAAQKQIDKDVLAAKNSLRDEMIDLVAMATEKVAGKVVSEKVNSHLIKTAVEKEEK